MTEPTPEEVEVYKRARRLMGSSYSEELRTVQVADLTISQHMDVKSQTCFLVVRQNNMMVRHNNVIVLKVIDLQIWSPSTYHEVLPSVVQTLRENMVLEDLADV